MASPTEAEIQGQLNKLILMLDEADKWNRSASKNVLAMYDDYADGLEGDFVSFSLQGADQFRALSSGLVDPATARRMLDPLLREYAKKKLYPETDPFAILDRLLVDFAENGGRVTTRAFTFGTPANVGSPTGTGLLKRLTVDRYGYAIEAATPEVKTFRCIADRYSGRNVHAELFEIRGYPIPRDYVSGIVGPDRVGTIAAISAEDSLRIVSNPSFNGYGGTAPNIDSITNWTVTTSINNFQIETTDVYRTVPHEGTAPGAVRFETNDKLTQVLSVVRPTLDPLVPYYAQLAFKRESSCDGTLTLRVGANSVAVALVAQSGWTVLNLVLNPSMFLRGFNATVLDIEIELSSNTTGDLLVDDLIIAPMTRFDGTWWALVGGATPWLVNDSITATDTCTEAIVQEWLWRTYDRYLPHASGGSVTWAEPS